MKTRPPSAPKRHFSIGPCLCWVGLALGAVGMAGCHKGPSSRSVQLVFSADSLLNSCGEDFGNALEVRVYQLTSDSDIALATRQSLWGDRSSGLESELIGSPHETFLEPGQQFTLPFKVDPATQVLAVAGNYCQTDGECWKWYQSTQDIKGKTYLTFGEFCVRMTDR